MARSGISRWPGKIKPGSVFTGIGSHIDMFPTLRAAAGDPDVTETLLNGCTVGSKTFKVHLDGYNMLPYVTGAVKGSPRNAMMYFRDDGEVMAVRVGDYKFNLAVQRATRMMQWAEPLVKLRLPLIFNLRRDPFERADINSNTYFDWMVDHVPQLYLMQAVVQPVPAEKTTSQGVLSSQSTARGPAMHRVFGIRQLSVQGARQLCPLSVELRRRRNVSNAQVAAIPRRRLRSNSSLSKSLRRLHRRQKYTTLVRFGGLTIALGT